MCRITGGVPLNCETCCCSAALQAAEPGPEHELGHVARESIIQ